MAIFGTRPETIKLAPVIATLKSDPARFRCTVTVTAQHRAMLDQMLKVFAITPDIDLDIMEDNQSLFLTTQKTIQRLEPVLEQYQPDLILVQGDTTSTFLGALAGFYKKIKTAHVEAGLRTHRKYSPFPEELNRRLTSVLADLHFAPTTAARDNLLREGIAADNIFVTGNTAVDAVLAIRRENFDFAPVGLTHLVTPAQRLIVITAHRRENWGQAFAQIAEAILQLAALYPDLQFVFPVHLNPNVQQAFNHRLGGHPRIHLIPPLDYRTFINLLSRCYFILTDSGGVQEEAPTLGKPVLVMRETTERPEGLVHGNLKLVGSTVAGILAEARRLLDEPAYYRASTQHANPYGDGRAAERIRNAILYAFGAAPERPADFVSP
ncbi:UDP-N-acetylglucosamine 2-epimerase (non-hydrolyzing) [candidate division KSB1 bacterium]|nr:UDP-N-acetylglucosamine 2-epimerase (non-hydrolyzing) [bacterium]NUM67236.1 UDP-N-acetylglucosamine 2-epimerase (non-hydrolyzing) [candidate division KSB1 bacterium]